MYEVKINLFPLEDRFFSTVDNSINKIKAIEYASMKFKQIKFHGYENSCVQVIHKREWRSLGNMEDEIILELKIWYFYWHFILYVINLWSDKD